MAGDLTAAAAAAAAVAGCRLTDEDVNSCIQIHMLTIKSRLNQTHTQTQTTQTHTHTHTHIYNAHTHKTHISRVAGCGLQAY